MSSRNAVVALAILALSAGCQQAPQGLTPADEAALRASVDSFVARVRRADWPGTAGLFGAQGMMMPPNESTVTGRDAITGWMQAYPPITAFEAGVDEVGGSGEVAYVRGHYAITVMPPGAKAAVADTGKFVSVSRRQADGSWLIVADIFNSNKAVAM